MAQSSIDVPYEHLLYPICLHLPINLIWRLIPLSSSFRRIMSMERFWRDRCEREFPLLHDNITNYRHYFLKRTRNGYGNLYVMGRLIPEIQQAQRIFYITYAKLIVWTRSRQLYQVDWLGRSNLVLSEVDSMFQLDDQTLIVHQSNEKHWSLLKGSVIDGGAEIRKTLFEFIPGIQSMLLFREQQIYLDGTGTLRYHSPVWKIETIIPLERKIIQFVVHDIYDNEAVDVEVVFSDGRTTCYYLQLPVPPRDQNLMIKGSYDGIGQVMGLSRKMQRIPYDGPIRDRSALVSINLDGTGELNCIYIGNKELRYTGIIDFITENTQQMAFIASKQM